SCARARRLPLIRTLACSYFSEAAPAEIYTLSLHDALPISSHHTQLINGVFYGAMFIMIMYQLFLFLSIRDKSTGYYVLTLIAMANVIAFFQGYTFLFLHPEYPGLNDDFAALSGPFFVVSSALLTRSFLGIRNFSPALDNILILNTCINIVAGAL